VDPLRCTRSTEALAHWNAILEMVVSGCSSVSCVMIDSKCIFLPKNYPSRSHEGGIVSQRSPRASLRTVCAPSKSTQPRGFGEVSARSHAQARGCVLLAVFAGSPESFTTSSSAIRAPPDIPSQSSPHVYNQPSSRPFAIDR